MQPLDILRTYGKVALKAHEKTNCLTEVLLPDAEGWLQDGSSINLNGPLAGIPVSLKDTVVVSGYDATVGYSSFVGNAKQKDGALVRLLKDAGAVPYVKTNIPISLLSSPLNPPTTSGAGSRILAIPSTRPADPPAASRRSWPLAGGSVLAQM